MADLEFNDLIRNPLDFNSPTIQTDILQRPELAECRGTKNESLPTKGGLFSHQKFFSRIIEDVDKMILYHDMGSGKSLTIIAAMERLFDLYQLGSTNIKRCIFIVSSNNIEAEIRLEIERYVKIRRKELNSIREHIKSWYTFYHFESLARVIFRKKNEQPEISTEKWFENYIHSEFDDSCIFIDEYHELTNEISTKDNLSKIEKDEFNTLVDLSTAGVGSELIAAPAPFSAAAAAAASAGSIDKHWATVPAAIPEPVREAKLRYKTVRDIIKKMKRSKIILGSGTPILNSAVELNNALILINANETFPDNFDYVRGDLEIYKKILRGLVSRVRALDTGVVEEFQGVNIYTLERIVAYIHKRVKADLIGTGADFSEQDYSDRFVHYFKLYQNYPEYYNNTPVSADGIEYDIVVYPCLMSRFQSRKYNEVSGKSGSRAFGTISLTFANVTFPYGKINTSTGQNVTKMEELVEIFTKTKDKINTAVDADYIQYYRGGAAVKLIASEQESLYKAFSYNDNLHKYAIKYYENIRLALSLPGKVQIYIHFTDAAGTKFFQQILEMVGIEIFSSRVGKKNELPAEKKLRFLFLDENVKSKKSVFNNPENDFGDYIKVIVLSPKSGRSLNLRSNLHVIMSSGEYTPSKNQQAIKRSIRANSHQHFVSIFQKMKRDGRDHPDVVNYFNTSEGKKIHEYFKTFLVRPQIPIRIYSLVAISTLPINIKQPYDEQDNVDIRAYKINSVKKYEHRVPLRNMEINSIDWFLNYDRNVYEGEYTMGPAPSLPLIPSLRQGSSTRDYYYLTYFFSGTEQIRIKEFIFSTLKTLKTFSIKYDDLVNIVSNLMISQNSSSEPTLDPGRLIDPVSQNPGRLIDPVSQNPGRLIRFTLENIISSKENFLNRYGIQNYLSRVSQNGILFMTPHFLNNFDEIEKYYGLLVYSENIFARDFNPVNKIIIENSSKEITLNSEKKIIKNIATIESILRKTQLERFSDDNERNQLLAQTDLIRRTYGNSILGPINLAGNDVLMHNLLSIAELESLSWKGSIQMLQLRILTYDHFRKDFFWFNSDEIVGSSEYIEAWKKSKEVVVKDFGQKAKEDRGYYGCVTIESSGMRKFTLRRDKDRIITDRINDRTILSNSGDINISNIFLKTRGEKGIVCTSLKLAESLFICYDLGIDLGLRQQNLAINTVDLSLLENVMTKRLSLNHNPKDKYKELIDIISRYRQIDLIKIIHLINYMEMGMMNSSIINTSYLCDKIFNNLKEKGLIY